MTRITRRQALAAAAFPALLRGASTEVPPFDPRKVKPSDFADEDLDLPFYVTHFSRLANAVRLEEPDRGFIALSVWRAEKDNRPHNARIMENILSLAWFYTARQRWNPYRGHPALRVRLEAALDFWRRSQNADGRFSEYSPGGWNLPATAFAVKFMGEALRLLKTGPEIDGAIHAGAVEACRKAARVVLTDAALYQHGLDYTNQFTNVYAGAPAFLRIYPDAELDRLLRESMRKTEKEFQSPVGYFYEAGGPDFGYNLSTHHENVAMAWHYFRGAPEGEILARQENLFAEWLSFNALPEPGTDGYILNRSIETRQQHDFVRRLDTPAAERAELARGFATPPAARQAAIRARREMLEKEWPRVEPLRVGDFWSFSPYTFLQRAHFKWHPTDAQITAAAARLPGWRRAPFLHQRMDTRRPIVFTYVRRPAYYAAFSSGELIREQQRLGLGLLWTPSFGGVLQSQTRGSTEAWGTARDAGGTPFEARTIPAEFVVDGAAVRPQPGNRDLPGKSLLLRYALEGGGEKTIEFTGNAVRVAVRRAGRITENLPMLVRAGDSPRMAAGRVSAPGWSVATAARVDILPERPLRGLATKRLAVVRLAADGALHYQFDFGG